MLPTCLMPCVQMEAAGQAVIEALASSSSSGVALQSSDIRVVYCKYDHCK